MMVAHSVDLLGNGIGPFVPRMPWLSAFGPPTGRVRGPRRRRWWVGRGWFRRILRMLIQAGFQFSNARVELSKLLLLLHDDGH